MGSLPEKSHRGFLIELDGIEASVPSLESC